MCATCVYVRVCVCVYDLQVRKPLQTPYRLFALDTNLLFSLPPLALIDIVPSNRPACVCMYVCVCVFVVCVCVCVWMCVYVDVWMCVRVRVRGGRIERRVRIP